MKFGYQNTNLESVSGQRSHLGAGTFFAHAVELTFLLDTPYLLVPRGSEVWRTESKVIGHAKDLKYNLDRFSAKLLIQGYLAYHIKRSTHL